MTRRCPDCNAPRKGEQCWKCSAETFEPSPEWVEPALPPIERIRALAREVGYAIGVHGSQERDLDLIAAPWIEDAIGPTALMEHIAAGIGAGIIDVERKPLGRYAATLQMEGWFKDIDLSVCPHAPTLPVNVLASALRQVERETLELAAKVCEERAKEISEWAHKQKKLSGRDLALARSSRDSLIGVAKIIRGEDIWEPPETTANELPTTQELADVSTHEKLIDRDQAIIATSIEADFEKGTWTFEPKGQWSVRAGDYYLIPIQAAEKGE